MSDFCNSLVNDELGEDQIPLIIDWIVVLVIYGFVHKWMGSDEIQHSIGQIGSIVDTCTRPRFRHLIVQHRQPSGIR